MYLLGVDIGTTGTKAVLADFNGNIISTTYCSYSLIKGANGLVEQNASDWWNTFVSTVTECTVNANVHNHISAISISSQGGSLVMVDKYGDPISNAMVWMDTRSTEICEKLAADSGEYFFYRKTGWKLNPGLNLCKIRWLSENRKKLFLETDKFLSTIDFVNMKLTGEAFIDPSNAAMTQLYNIEDCKWDNELLELANIKEEQLPRIVKSGEVIGNLIDEAAKELGLPSGIRVISGGHDQYCAAIGSGTIYPGQVMLSAGTAWAVLGITGNPVFDEESYPSPGPHLVNSMWGEMATVPTAGACMEWFMQQFTDSVSSGETDILTAVDANAKECRVSSEQLLFYPYFCGSGYPKHQLNTGAAFLGLGLEHSRYDIARAIMEGIAFQLKNVLEGLKLEYKSIRVIGGAAKSALWMEILSDILDIEVIKLSEKNAACIGAAITSGIGIGVWNDFKTGYSAFDSNEIVIRKNPEDAKFYNRKYKRYIAGLEFILDFYDSG